MLLSMDQCSNVLMDLGDTNKKKDHFCPHGLTVLVGNLDVHVKESAKQGRNTSQFAGPLPWIHLSSGVKIEIQVWFQLFSDNRIQ